VLGARAAVIRGCVATSNVLAGQRYGVNIAGTHAHSWVMSFDSELEAFRAYAAIYPDNLTLLVDTYDVLNSGVPNAITVFREVFASHGRPRSYGIRIDSGDLAYLSKAARTLLDEAGFADAQIVASNDLDEYTILDLQVQGAKIDAYGVGTRLITGYDQPAIGCVYKLAAEQIDGQWQPRLKRTENVEKVTNPGVKRILRFFDTQKMALADLLVLEDEPLPTQPFEIFDPVYRWKRKVIRHATVEELLKPIFREGRLVYESPSVAVIADRVQQNLKGLSEERTRLHQPHVYYVDLSQRLWELKMRLLSDAS